VISFLKNEIGVIAMSIPKKLDMNTANQLRSIFSRLDISKKKITIDLENDTIEIIDDDYSIDDILESAGALTPERAKEMQEEVKKMRREQRIKGRKLKTADALIIATAIENQLAIVSRDSDMYFTEKEFGIPVIRP
jgi:hypothetical protein